MTYRIIGIASTSSGVSLLRNFDGLGKVLHIYKAEEPRKSFPGNRTYVK